MPTKTITIYRKGENGEVEKKIVEKAPIDPITEGINYHQRIIKTYHELECSGQLNDMKPATKQYVRDVHTYAQNPAYWPEGE